MGGLIRIDDIPAFREVRNIAPAGVTKELRLAVKELHEAEDIEEFIRSILCDRAATPHGPADSRYPDASNRTQGDERD